MNDLTLGTRVVMTGTVAKEQHVHSELYPYPMRTTYEEQALPSMTIYRAGGKVETREFAKGVIVGKRTVVPGKTVLDGAPETYERVFLPEVGSGRVVYLVAYHLRRKPVMCFPEQICPEAAMEGDPS